MWKFSKVVFDKQQAQLPTLIKLDKLTIRLYFSTRINNLSHIFFVNLNQSLEVISEVKLALSPGQRGSFDSSGVMPSCTSDGYMYYTGWSLRQDIPYTHAIGRAKILSDGTLQRIHLGPVLAINQNDEYLVNSPFIREDENKWKMYYSSGTGWHDNFPAYCIKEAHSLNGVNWYTSKEKFITFGYEDEAISRISVDQKTNTVYFSMRTKKTNYELYYLKNNKINKLEIEKQNWDSEMQCYPFFFEDDGSKYLFYNGNGYGVAGIGVAKWKEDIV